MNEFDLRNFLYNNPLLEATKKGNEEEEKREEGAIADDRDHIDALDADAEADEKKLAKLKKDFKKDVVKESEEVSEKQGYNDRDNEAIADKDGAESTKKMSRKGRRDISRGMEKALGNRPDSTDSKMDENQVEEYGKPIYDEDDTDAVKEQSSKMSVSELKAKIREDILSTLNETDEVNEDEDVDVDVDFEDEVKVDAEGDDIEIEKPAVKAKVQVGLSPEETIVQDSLKAAMDAADALGNDKLADQIGNTITFFTREYVVVRNSD